MDVDDRLKSTELKGIAFADVRTNGNNGLISKAGCIHKTFTKWKKRRKEKHTNLLDTLRKWFVSLFSTVSNECISVGVFCISKLAVKKELIKFETISE